jgi:hypothetical protein
MRHHRSLAACLLIACLLTFSAAAAAKPLIVSGRLDRAGYTVVALGYNGKVAISRARAFRLKVPAEGLTLQLVTRKGVYGGPVVIGSKGRWALEGIRRSVNLGRINVIPSAGYARVAHPLNKKTFNKTVDTRRLVLTRHGAPLGNGRNFGFVKSPGHGASGAGLDRDQDGVPDAFDVAANGRKILNALVPTGGNTHGVRLARGSMRTATAAASDPASAPVPAGVTPTPPSLQFDWMSQIFLSLDETLNADAAGVSKEQIDAMLVQHLNLKGGLPNADLLELDCGGLPYCSRGTSADVVTGDDMGPNPLTEPLSNFFNASGFPVLIGPGAAPLETTHGAPEFSLMPRATSDQIQTGDTPILRTTTGGVLTQTPKPIDFVFDTVPALASYDDGVGDSGAISYPAPPGEPGTQLNPIPVAANSTGDLVVALRFWRPQRKGIPGAGEPAFMDIGHLEYTVDATSLAQAAAGPGVHTTASSCSPASLRTNTPGLSVSSQPGPGAGEGFVIDSADDQPANPANLLGFSIDLTKCITDGGAPGLPVGTEGMLGLKANAPGSSDHAVQNVWIKRVR